MGNNDLLKIRYHQFCEVWQSLCKAHKNLFDLTCDEYVLLLESNLEKVEETVEVKSQCLEDISALESYRKELLTKLNIEFPQDTIITSATQLIDFFSKNIAQIDGLLEKSNQLLIEIMNTTRNQNKKNQLFLNKALMNLQEIKDTFTGVKSNVTYGPKGNLEKIRAR